jgi:hypothetical protein
MGGGSHDLCPFVFSLYPLRASERPLARGNRHAILLDAWFSPWRPGTSLMNQLARKVRSTVSFNTPLEVLEDITANIHPLTDL